MLLFNISRRAFSSRKIYDCYSALNVGPSASEREIRQNYLELIKTYHPDNKETGNQKKFIRVQNAYEIIKRAPLSARHNGSLDYTFTLDETDEDGQKPDLTHKAYVEEINENPLNYQRYLTVMERSLYGSQYRLSRFNLWKMFLSHPKEWAAEREAKLKDMKDDF